MRMTQFEVDQYNARLATTHPSIAQGVRKATPARESVLHRQIRQECHRRGLKCSGGRMDKRTGRDAGEPDFRILLPSGRTLLIEAKTTTGNLSEDQERWHAEAWALGHTVYVVREFAEFHGILRGLLT